jgi:hypothetical protein
VYVTVKKKIEKPSKAISQKYTIMENGLHLMKVSELKSLCKERGFTKYSKLKKSYLITLLNSTSLEETESNYNKMKTRELRALCKEKGFTKYSKLKKSELIALLEVSEIEEKKEEIEIEEKTEKKNKEKTENYNKMKTNELKTLCKELGYSGFSKFKKIDLIYLLENNGIHKSETPLAVDFLIWLESNQVEKVMEYLDPSYPFYNDLKLDDGDCNLLCRLCSSYSPDMKEIVRAIINHPNNDINGIDYHFAETALIHAVRSKNQDLVEMLLECPNIDLKYKGEDGTAMDLAKKLKLTEIFELLKNY